MLVVGLFLFAWFFVCIWLYRAFHAHAWLAGLTTASCAFFLGATFACGCFVGRAIFLVPLGAAVLTLLAIHARASRVHDPAEGPPPAPSLSEVVASPPVALSPTSDSIDKFAI